MIQGYIYGALGVVILALGLGTYIATTKYLDKRDELTAYQASAAAVIAERIAALDAEKERNARKTKETTDAYRTRLAALDKRLAATAGERDAVAERLRDALAARPDAVPTAPGAAAGTDGGPGRDELLEELAGCLKNTEQLRALQEWLRATH